MRTGRMHADEAEIDTALVRRLLAGQFPRWAELPLRRFPSAGTVNAVYRLGESMAVRLPLNEGGAGDVAKEARWLPRLAPGLPVAVPEVLGVGSPAAGYPWPWAVHRWLDGAAPVVGELADPAGLAGGLAAFVGALQRIDPEGGPSAYRGGPLGAADAGTRAAIGALYGEIDTAAATAAWESALGAPGWQGRPVWLHGDLMPGNLLLGGGRLSAVIDFGTLGVGDPAIDTITAWNLLPAAARAGFRAALGVDGATWARGRGWALSMALIQLPYYRDTNPAMAANARHVIGQVLAEHAAAG
jgi:aminoglycoside phosphotransferase (APT) family kinase protein